MEKSFFKKRTINEIRDLNNYRTYTQRNLVEKIDNLDPDLDALEIRTIITPHKFFLNPKTGKYTLTGEQASRKCFKHGDLIPLSHPMTKNDCYYSCEIPLQIRARDFSKNSRHFKGKKEEDINYIGYSCSPQWGDRIRRVFPFVFIDQGVELFSYDENVVHGESLDIEDLEIQCYADAARVRREGADAIVSVPSRTKKHPRYRFKLLHTPILRSQSNLSTVLSLKPTEIRDEETGDIKQGRTLHDRYNIRYTYEDDKEGSEVITIYPQIVTAYLGIIKHENNKHNLTPIDMNPFALPSKQRAEFYKKLGNNILIYDPTLESKDKLRKPHLDEKSILLARGIWKFEHDNFAYWSPERDGKLKDYWSI